MNRRKIPLLRARWRWIAYESDGTKLSNSGWSYLSRRDCLEALTEAYNGTLTDGARFGTLRQIDGTLISVKYPKRVP